MEGARLRTARLLLRPFAPPDADALHALWTQEDVRRYLWDGKVVAREQVAAIVEESIASFAARGYGFWAIEPRAGGPLLGFAGLRPIPEQSDVELYYGLDRAHWGQGYATEASRAVLRHGLEAAGLDPIYLRTDGPNAASVAVMERLGARWLRTEPTGAFGTTIVYVARWGGVPPPG